MHKDTEIFIFSIARLNVLMETVVDSLNTKLSTKVGTDSTATVHTDNTAGTMIGDEEAETKLEPRPKSHGGRKPT